MVKVLSEFDMVRLSRVSGTTQGGVEKIALSPPHSQNSPCPPCGRVLVSCSRVAGTESIRRRETGYIARVMQHSAVHRLAAALGIHPVPAFVVITVDWMLFVAAVGTFGTGWTVSIPLAIVLALAVVLFQHRGSPHDELGLAVAKGLFVGILTAIPTALPSYLVLGQGIAGGVAMYLDHRSR